MKIIIRIKRPQTDQKAKDDDENKKKKKEMTHDNILYPNCQHQLVQTVMNLVQQSLRQIIITQPL